MSTRTRASALRPENAIARCWSSSTSFRIVRLSWHTGQQHTQWVQLQYRQRNGPDGHRPHAPAPGNGCTLTTDCKKNQHAQLRELTHA